MRMHNFHTPTADFCHLSQLNEERLNYLKKAANEGVNYKDARSFLLSFDS
jgi:hypothetical protein